MGKRSPLHRALLQPPAAAVTAIVGLVIVAASWFVTSAGARSPISPVDLAVGLCLAAATVAAYRWPIHLHPHTKVNMASVPYYLLAVLVPIPLAATVGGVAALIGELSVQRERATTRVSIAAESGRRVLVVWLGALVAHLPGGAGEHIMALVAAAIVMLATDIATCPLVLTPLSGEPPVRIIIAVSHEAYLMEGAQYLLGLLGALAAAQQIWAMVVLALPTALLYLAFRALSQAEQARHIAETAQRQAEDAVRVRNNFLLAGSHDLRTPLTAVVGRADLLLQLMDTGAQDLVQLHNHIVALRAAASRMERTVEEITDAAHLQMGQMLSLQIAAVDMGDLVKEAAHLVGSSNGQGSAPIIVEASPNTVLEGDHARLQRVVLNILANAVKYSPGGETVQVEVYGEDDRVIVTTRDRGVGIPATDLPHIFTTFYRGSTATGFPGSGIGLAGARAIVEQHGGTVDVQSTAGAGTSVTLSLPRSRSPRACATPVLPAPDNRVTHQSFSPLNTDLSHRR